MSRVATVFYIGFVWLLIAGFATQPSIFLAAYLVACALYVLAHARRLTRLTRSELASLGLMLAGPTSLVVIGIARDGPTVAFHWIISVTAAIAACAATRNSAVYSLMSKWGLIGAQLFVLAYLARTGVYGFPLENLIPGHSSNGITSYLVVLQINYSIVTFVLQRRVPWITLMASLGICLVGYGRGSILAVVSLILASLVVSVVPSRRRSAFLQLLFVAGCIAGLVTFRAQLVQFADANTKIGAGLEDPGRALMLQQYVTQLNPGTALLGGSYDNTVINRDFRGNPHNSFIRGHHLFGLGYLLVIIFLPWYVAAKSRMRMAGKGYFLMLVLILYTRAFTEPILFPTVFDFFFFGMCFIALTRDAGSPEPVAEGVSGAQLIGETI